MMLDGVFINLDASTIRLARVQSQLKNLGRLGARYRRFAAVDGRAVARRGDVSNPAELGCYLSHMHAIDANAASEHWLHVLEDDVLISRYALGAIREFISNSEFDRFDLIFTNIMFQVGSESVAMFRTLFDKSVEVDENGNVTKLSTYHVISLQSIDFLLATSYLIHPRAKRRIADLLKTHLAHEPFLPVDNVFAKLVRSGALSAGCAIPFITMPPISADSTIRGEVSHCRLSQMVMEASLYVERDVPALRALLKTLAQGQSLSATAEILAEANRVLIARDLNLPTRRGTP
jgi:GR25 family glycosyltransferase involved in LPS biosynthesis